jgi:hypothetical protein
MENRQELSKHFEKNVITGAYLHKKSRINPAFN